MPALPEYFWMEPGRHDQEEGLRARVADPVWFLTRQWQLGELQGEDASSPVVVTAAPRHIPLTYSPSRPALDPTVIPAESLVEAEPGDWWTMGRRVRLGIAAQAQLDPADRDAYVFGALPAPYEKLASKTRNCNEVHEGHPPTIHQPLVTRLQVTNYYADYYYSITHDHVSPPHSRFHSPSSPPPSPPTPPWSRPTAAAIWRRDRPT